ncbi:ABC transporter ATP-binding protein [Desulfitibacter alkalitolerans]|uniref:ABC transporter ATP-binding protein n=1 Tax=Desulfitibacter alkalitolerans TaxID=264641 RepID=UPI0012EC4D10|nr:ABC transporter ATP-binding protein [Desulfitibacter alkalitolerans]
MEANMQTNPLVHVDNISKSYGRTQILQNLSLKVEEESCVVIMGPSGSGKTTLLRLIAGLEVPDQGSIYLGDRLASDERFIMPPHLRRLGFVFQTPALWPHMTVKENISFGMEPDKNNGTKVLELLSRMKMEHLSERYPDQLSGGEARRVSLARALAPRPKCILMDEPLTNLDYKLKSTLLELINEIFTMDKLSLIFVTHDQGEAMAVQGKILNLSQGTLIC